MSIKTWQERLAWITSTSYQGYASQEEIDACKQAELDELRAALARRTGEIEQLTETSLWQAGRISELLDAVAAQRKVLEQALVALTVSDNIDLVGAAYSIKAVVDGHWKISAAITAIQEVLK